MDVAVLATMLMGAGTLAGVAVVRRVPPGSVPTVALTAVVIVLFGLGDVLPQAYSASRAAGLPPWYVALALGAGALLAFSSGATCCGCSGALPGTTGLMILGAHRFLEGSATALLLSTSVVAVMFVHSLSEGLASGPMLLGMERSRVVVWLVVVTIAPVLGDGLHVGATGRASLAPLTLALLGGWMLVMALRSTPGRVRAVTQLLRAGSTVRGERCAATSAGS